MAEYKGINYLRSKLEQKRKGVIRRYRYYDMKNIARDLNISTPPELRWFMGCLGWCGKAVDSLADRLTIRGFRNDNFNIEEIFNMNNPDVLYSSVIHGALVSACDFIYISQDAEGYPRLQVINGGDATGILNPIVGMLDEGYAVLERDDHGNPLIEAYFIKGQTQYHYKGINGVQVFENNAPYPLLVPIIYRPDASRPFGHSRISRACMDLTNSALRTIKRSEIAAEFYSYPQKYITGLSEDAELQDKWKATMSALMTFTKDEDGDAPTLGQFSQQSMAPHLEQLKMFASLFAGECGLTLDDMGFPTSNPSSAEAIKSAHENLRLNAKKAQKSFGSGFLNAGYLAVCLRDNIPYKRNQFYLTEARWMPIFEPDASQMSGLGDALVKIGQAAPGSITTELLEDLTGFTLE